MSDSSPANLLKSLQRTFDELPTIAKVGAIAAVMVLGLSLLSLVLKLVMSMIVVAVLAMGGYVVYKFFLDESKSS